MLFGWLSIRSLPQNNAMAKVIIAWYHIIFIKKRLRRKENARIGLTLPRFVFVLQSLQVPVIDLPPLVQRMFGIVWPAEVWVDQKKAKVILYIWLVSFVSTADSFQTGIVAAYGMNQTYRRHFPFFWQEVVHAALGCEYAARTEASAMKPGTMTFIYIILFKNFYYIG